MNITRPPNGPPTVLMKLRIHAFFFSDLWEAFSKTNTRSNRNPYPSKRQPEHRDKLLKLCFLSRTVIWTLRGSVIWLFHDSLPPLGCGTDYSGARLLGDTELLGSERQRRNGSLVKHLQS